MDVAGVDVTPDWRHFRGAAELCTATGLFWHAVTIVVDDGTVKFFKAVASKKLLFQFDLDSFFVVNVAPPRSKRPFLLEIRNTRADIIRNRRGFLVETLSSGVLTGQRVLHTGSSLAKKVVSVGASGISSVGSGIGAGIASVGSIFGFNSAGGSEGVAKDAKHTVNDGEDGDDDKDDRKHTEGGHGEDDDDDDDHDEDDGDPSGHSNDGSGSGTGDGFSGLLLSLEDAASLELLMIVLIQAINGDIRENEHFDGDIAANCGRPRGQGNRG
jgi:hypothetical protein